MGHCAGRSWIWVLGLDDDDLIGKGGVREEERKEQANAAATCYNHGKLIAGICVFRYHCDLLLRS